MPEPKQYHTRTITFDDDSVPILQIRDALNFEFSHGWETFQVIWDTSNSQCHLLLRRLADQP